MTIKVDGSHLSTKEVSMRIRLSLRVSFSTFVFMLLMMPMALGLLGCSGTPSVATQTLSPQGASVPGASSEVVAARRKTTSAKCTEFIQWQLGMLVYKSGPKLEEPSFIDDGKGTWMTLPFTVISKRNQPIRLVAFCHLSTAGDFDKLSGGDEKDLPEWWSPENQTTQEAADAKERREKVYLSSDIPAKYIPLVRKAMALAKQNTHCTRVADADYIPTDVYGKRKFAPFVITCVVNNPRVPSSPYANYNYTREQVEKGIAKPYSTLGDY